MNWCAFWALFRREVKRGQKSVVILAMLGVAATVCAIVLTPGTAVAVGIAAIAPAFIVIFWPIGDLRTDKTHGNLEFDRVLPISHRAIAAARLFGAGVRTTPMILLILPIFIGQYRAHEFGGMTFIMLATFVPTGVWVLFTALMWLLMAVNIRWNLRKLWWLPMTIGFSPTILRNVLPDGFKSAMKRSVEGFFDRDGDALVAFAGSPAGVVTISAILLSIPLAMLFGAVSLFASGLERYTYDASAAVPMQAKPPKRELAAIGRGPTLAVTRYCMRLAMEQSWRRLILLAVFVVVLIVGSRELKDYARIYVRALAALIPGGIALQLSVARARGHLEGIQQLPHPAVTIGTGYLLAVTILATPGAAVWVLARAVTGMAATAPNVVSLWAWMVAWSWIACVLMIWLNTRRALMIGAVPVIALGSWAAYAGLPRFVEGARAMALAFGEFRVAAGAVLPLTVAGAMMVLGLPLFARGLTEFEVAGAGRVWRWRQLLARPASRA